MHGYPPPTYPSAESVKDAWVAYAATYGNPVEWATGRWDYALIQNAYPPDCYRLQLTRDGSETQPPPYQMMGWYLPGCASQGTIYGSTIINPQPTSINQGTKISSQIYANLYAVDLINEKLWYSTQKVTTTGVPIGLGDFEYSSSIELKIMCNDTVLLSEISSG
jgi:hypothetical protein